MTFSRREFVATLAASAAGLSCSARSVPLLPPLPQNTEFTPSSAIVFDQNGQMHIGLEAFFTAHQREPFNLAQIARQLPPGYSTLEFRSITLSVMPLADHWDVVLVLIYLSTNENGQETVPVASIIVKADEKPENVVVPNFTADLHGATYITVQVQEIGELGRSNFEIQATGQLK